LIDLSFFFIFFSFFFNFFSFFFSFFRRLLRSSSLELEDELELEVELEDELEDAGLFFRFFRLLSSSLELEDELELELELELDACLFFLFFLPDFLLFLSSLRLEECLPVADALRRFPEVSSLELPDDDLFRDLRTLLSTDKDLESILGRINFFFYGPPRVPLCRRSLGKVRPLR
jgi:hypothetical protein